MRGLICLLAAALVSSSIALVQHRVKLNELEQKVNALEQYTKAEIYKKNAQLYLMNSQPNNAEIQALLADSCKFDCLKYKEYEHIGTSK